MNKKKRRTNLDVFHDGRDAPGLDGRRHIESPSPSALACIEHLHMAEH